MGFNPDQPRVPSGPHGGEFGKGNGGTSRPTDGDLVKFKPLKTTGGPEQFADFSSDDVSLANDLTAMNVHDEDKLNEWLDAHPESAKVYEEIGQKQHSEVAQTSNGTGLQELSDAEHATLIHAMQGAPGIIVNRLGDDQETLGEIFNDLPSKGTTIYSTDATNPISGSKSRSSDFQPIAMQVKDSLYLVHYPGEGGRRDVNAKGDKYKFESAEDLEKARSDFAKANPKFFKKG